MSRTVAASLFSGWLALVCYTSPSHAQDDANNSAVSKDPPRVERNISPPNRDEAQGGPSARETMPFEPFMHVPAPGCPYRQQQLELIV